jgi:hypothetical protein
VRHFPREHANTRVVPHWRYCRVAPVTVLACLVAGAAPRGDGGHSALADDVVLRLANAYAPVLFYEADEPNLPTSVDRFLRLTELWFFSRHCQPNQFRVAELRSSEIPATRAASCVPSQTIDSEGTRSTAKETTFYLGNVPEADRRGSTNSEEWVTYLHAYPNDLGGITLQFWRCYAYNTGYMAGFRAWGASHGGDWEAIHVVLGPAPAFAPVQIRLLGHVDITTRPWSEVATEGGHPLIRCSKGSHTSLLIRPGEQVPKSRLIEQESWSGGAVHWPGGRVTRSGPIVNLGEKTEPRRGVEWLRYSGLWGTREGSGFFAVYRSGYWGPAFNETGMHKDGFNAAWCEGIARTPGDEEAFRRECYASSIVP